MKAVIGTDIHGSLKGAKMLVEAMKKEGADRLIILGDFYYHGPRNPLPDDYNPAQVAELFNGISDRIIAVKGNCDAEIDETISNFRFDAGVTVIFGGKEVLFTHGQHYNSENIPIMPSGGIMVYGHFHVNRLHKGENVTAVNLASVSLPKEGCPPSYGVIDDSGLRIKDFSDNIIFDIAF